MRIAFISAGGYMEHEDYAKGDLLGTEHQIFGLSKELVKKGYEVYIVRKWHESIIEDVENVKILSFKSGNHRKPGLKLTFSKLKFSRIVAKAINKIGFDIVVVIDPFTSYHALKLSIPKVLVTHSQIPYELLPPEVLMHKKIILLKIKKAIQKRMFNKADVIIALNRAIEDYLKSTGYRTRLIPNGIEIKKYVPNYSDEGYILFGGRLVKEKGLGYLIRAYSMLDKKIRREYKLVMVGFGPEKNNLEKLAIELEIKDKVEFIPWLHPEAFIKKISNCSVFVLPSLYECMPVTLLEAMASGKPVIVSDIPGPQDIITQGYNGFLFEKENVDELKKYLELLLTSSELRKKIGENARKTVEDKYTFTKIADEYLKVFNDLVGDRNAHR